MTVPWVALGAQKCTEASRWRLSQRGLPLALLLLALATPFLFVTDHGYFYQPGHHDFTSSKFLSLAENLTAQRPFARFQRLVPDPDGKAVPLAPYNRFPIGGYWLIKLVTLPFGEALPAKILAARTLMLTCFAAASVLAYLSLARTVGSRWIACAATALVFSSKYCLYYSDMISTEVSMDLFAVMLAFHGMVVFVQEENAFRQLLVKTCVAVALGWHVYALLLPFIALSLASELASTPSRAPRIGGKIKHFAAVLLLGRPFALGVAALGFGLLVLSANLIAEYHLLDETASVAELPTWSSIMLRMGLDEPFNVRHEEVLSWPTFLESQFRRLGEMFFPIASGAHDRLGAEAWMEDLLLPVGVAALAVCLVWLCFNRHRVLFAALAASGFVWSLPMRHSVAFHDFESVFYLGIPLTLFALALWHMRQLSGERPVAFVAVAALLVFVASNWQMQAQDEGAAGKAFHMQTMSDFEVIRSRTAGGVIGIMLIGEVWPGTIGSIRWEHGGIPAKIGAPFALEYYLSQRAITALPYPTMSEFRMEEIDFVVTDWREPGTLTPDNHRFYLYSRHAFVESDRPDTLPGDLLGRGKFDLYQNAYALVHVKSRCGRADRLAPFALHLWPADRTALPTYRRQHGFGNYDFDFRERGIRTRGRRGHRVVLHARFAERDAVQAVAGAAGQGSPARREHRKRSVCVAWTKLPDYDVARIGTGQYDESGLTWWLDIPLAQ